MKMRLFAVVLVCLAGACTEEIKPTPIKPPAPPVEPPPATPPADPPADPGPQPASWDDFNWDEGLWQ